MHQLELDTVLKFLSVLHGFLLRQKSTDTQNVSYIPATKGPPKGRIIHPVHLVRARLTKVSKCLNRLFSLNTFVNRCLVFSFLVKSSTHFIPCFQPPLSSFALLYNFCLLSVLTLQKASLVCRVSSL